MKKQRSAKNKIKGAFLVLLVLALVGIIGGILIKVVFYQDADDKMMSNKEANRLIRYLSINDYHYSERLGSSFTVKSARELLEAANVSEDKISFSLKNKPGFFPLTKKQFETIYNDLIVALELDRLSNRDLYIFEIDAANDEEIDGVVYELVSTNAGNFYMEKAYGMDRSEIGNVVRVYISNNEIILCLGKSDETVVMNSVYSTKLSVENGQKTLAAYAGGKLREFPVADGFAIDDCEPALYDVTIGNAGVVGITKLTDRLVEKKVTSYSDGMLKLEGTEEPYYLSDMFFVYQTNNGIRVSSSAGTLIGYDEVSLQIEDNIVLAAVVNEDVYSKNIRVLINNTGYESPYHSRIYVSSDTPFTICYGETVDEYNAGERVEFRNGSKELANGLATVQSKEKGGKITLTGVERQCGSPSYRGVIELSKSDEGVIVINELPIEEYLYGVVPSEMPVSYNLEALKAQAICARAYAFRQMNSDTYAEFGAHLDDSVASQVYNNVEEDERSIYAVDDTYGVVPCYGNDVIEAFFFSTSCGTTSSNSAVWGGNQQPYLLDTFENDMNDIANLANEDVFQSFIDGDLGVGFFEENEPFYRWNIKYTKAQITNAVNNQLYNRIQAMPENILALNAEGTYEKKVLKSIGEVTDITITKRGKSGIIEEMEIVGTEETILVKGQGNVRALFSPYETTIYKQDGSTLTGWTSLPSAYFYVENNGNVFTLNGGGFGHGVGMSQNGANDMAALGYNARDIIEHYYSATELKDMYELMGK